MSIHTAPGSARRTSSRERDMGRPTRYTCECEHVAHGTDELTPMGRHGHCDGCEVEVLVSVRTIWGTFKVCPACASDCLAEYDLDVDGAFEPPFLLRYPCCGAWWEDGCQCGNDSDHLCRTCGDPDAEPMCASCGRPSEEHCKLHTLPCCPGHCPGVNTERKEI